MKKKNQLEGKMGSRHAILVAIFVSSLGNSVPIESGVHEHFESSQVNPDVLDVNYNNYRLPGESVPISYDILLMVESFQTNPLFVGTSNITIDVKNKTTSISFHAQNLTIIEKDIVLTNTANKSLSYPIVKVSESDPITNIVTITSKKEIPVGTYVFQLQFRGTINDEKKGFYRSTYIHRFGEIEWMASTHFEPFGARLAFPCWDEPGLKATFKLSIRCDKKYTVLSNTQEIASITDTKKTTYFEKTPKMSTYLVAFIIAEFDFLRSKNDPNFRVLARKNAIEHGKYAVEIGEKILEALGNYTTIKYGALGINKMDSIAVPVLSAGAMENWGLVTFREHGLLVQEDVTSTFDKEGVATVIAHEFAHQWFGNSLTPEWWSYIWLNEGFANYFQYVITDQIEPTWQLMQRFVVKNLQATAFPADSKNTSHALDIEAITPEQINKAFDSISYSKGGSVIRMIFHVLGEDKFKNAIKQYLTVNERGTVSSDNLFKKFVAVGTNIQSFKEILKNWATTPGYPVIQVTRNYTSGTVAIVQSRFLYNSDSNCTTTYWVPLNYVTEDSLKFDDTKPTHWLSPTDKSKEILNITTKDKFVLFNKQQTGYYRVNYDQQNWDLITAFLKKPNFTDIHVVNRAQLIDDAFNLARIGQLNYSVTLSLVEYLKEETDYLPWEAAWNGFSYLNKILAHTPHSKTFQNYVLKLSDKLVKNVTFEESPKDDHVTKLKRISALNWVDALGSQDCRNNAFEKIKKWLVDSKQHSLSSDLKALTLCAGIRNADDNTWNMVFNKSLNGTDTDLFTALACTSKPVLLNFFLNKSISIISDIDNVNTIIKAVYTKTNEGVDIALDFIIQNFEKIITLNGGDNKIVGTFIKEIGDRLTTEDQVKKLREFTENNQERLPNDVFEGLENAHDNLKWRKTLAKDVELFFKSKDSTPPSGNEPDGSTMIYSSVFALIASFLISQM